MSKNHLLGKEISQAHPSPDREETRLILFNRMWKESEIHPRVVDSGQPAFPVTDPAFPVADSVMARVHVEFYTLVPDFRASGLGAPRGTEFPRPDPVSRHKVALSSPRLLHSPSLRSLKDVSPVKPISLSSYRSAADSTTQNGNPLLSPWEN